jgi:cell wall-associated NlpC family hydrolase
MAGIPAGTVLLVAAGGVLVYAGFTSQNPLAALKNVSSGKPTPVRNQPGVDSASFASTGAGGIARAIDVGPGGGIPNLPQACARFSGDRYSQVRRWQDGYSDCSSFVGKGLKLLGIKPPGASTTGAYLASREWKQVPSTSVQPGDLAISLNHVVVCLGSGKAIGQQNPKVNVQTGKVDDLMIGNKPFIYIRYMPGSAATASTPPKSAAV